MRRFPTAAVIKTFPALIFYNCEFYLYFNNRHLCTVKITFHTFDRNYSIILLFYFVYETKILQIIYLNRLPALCVTTRQLAKLHGFGVGLSLDNSLDKQVISE